MATTYTLISTVTVGSGGAANIEFTSIPATYTDLLVLSSCRGTTAGEVVDSRVTFNNSTTSFSGKNLESNSQVSPYSQTGGSNSIKLIDVGANSTSNTFSNIQIYILNYAGSNNKSVLVDNVGENNASGYSWLQTEAGLWSNSSAITSIKLAPDTGTYVQHSSASLYGIKNS